ncbi:MAG TPA: hypothetical protein VF715_12480 [Thermoleophilaceae bacterium]
MTRSRGAATLAAAAVAALAAAAPPAGAASYPKIEQLVVFRDGTALQKSATAKQVTTRVGGRDCAIGSATALAALVRIKPPSLRLRDYGRCSKRASDAEQLFVRTIGKDTNKGFDGWVYKVGGKLATAGAGDPGGPFGRGRLKNGQRVTWFYCRLVEANCQGTLALKASTVVSGQVSVTVRAYDDRGKSVPAAGATVRAGDATATTGEDGQATLTLPAGAYRVHAERAGDIRSFGERVDVE